MASEDLACRWAEFATAPDLVGGRVRLAQLDPGHAPALAKAAEGLDNLWYTTVPSPDGMDAEIQRRLELQRQRSMAPFTVFDGDTPIGMTTFMRIDAESRRVEIGSTWIAAEAQGTRINPEMKLLLLNRAFSDLDCIAVEFRTHWHNFHSRAAIAKLGAKQDGVLRNHTILSGVLRDTVVFSIIAAEWPTVELGLRARLSRLA